MIRTWQFFTPGTRLARVAQATCGWLIGHQDSGDKGYCGGDFEDRWCRWCNLKATVPKGQFARKMEWKFGQPAGGVKPAERG